MQIPQGKKIYFSSDNHLGAPTQAESLPREKIFVKWLDTIKHDAEAIFLLGDLFDFWFEYKTVAFKSTFLWATMIYGCTIILRRN
jgi:UDP-2,3-diacylglucosamine hydrolase